ncbi:hypothetical protein EXT67_20620 [Pectobacterium atrosepticum]|uniref:hypothetical protein n=1 Tax=Pectobacterium atrosepticum TaxID=29471 RepID=UPI00201B3620|nr:hypothetical protein [Pectobacterium atrosepticum]MCL6318710.1 hypothetical protein [Pectobacterium atrosepticum]MCL6409153.1 hypothetical protein [Dickeya dadantii]
MTNKTVTASAVVTLTLSIENLGTWGGECQVDQVLRQAQSAAQHRAHKILAPGAQGVKIAIGPITIKECE